MAMSQTHILFRFSISVVYWHQKTIRVLSCVFLCMILLYHFDTIPSCDWQTGIQTHDDGIYCAAVASCSKIDCPYTSYKIFLSSQIPINVTVLLFIRWPLNVSTLLTGFTAFLCISTVLLPCHRSLHVVVFLKWPGLRTTSWTYSDLWFRAAIQCIRPAY